MDVSSPTLDPKLGTQAGEEQAVEGGGEDVEPEGLDVPFILKTAVAGTVVLVIIVILIIQFIALERREQQLAAAEQAEFVEQRALEQQSLEQLQSYGPVAEEEDVYHVPIDEAIEYVVTQRYGGNSGQQE